MASARTAAESTKGKPRRRSSHALAIAASKCEKPFIHRWTEPSHVPIFSAGVFWIIKKADEEEPKGVTNHL